MLRRLRLQLAGGADERNQREVNVERVIAADVLPQLPNRLEKREAFDVADGAADLHEHDVDAMGHAPDRVFDLVSKMRNDLHRPSEIVAAPLLLNDALIDLSRRPVRLLCWRRVGEALVMPEIEVRLGAIVGDVHLAVLIRAHRPRVDVDVRVELLHRDCVTMPFEQAPDGCGGESFAEGGHHAARHKNVLRGLPVRIGHVCAPCAHVVGAAISRRTCSRSSGVSTPSESYFVSTALMRIPCSSARSCSSDSVRSRGVGSSVASTSSALRR